MKLEDQITDSLINKKYIIIRGFRNHTKASESYVDVDFNYPLEARSWSGSIPYSYRRLGLFLEDSKDIAELVDNAYESLNKNKSEAWVAAEKKVWDKEYQNKAITKPFFDKLLNLQWNCVTHAMPPNPNWARRIQDIKELGYLLATDTSKYCDVCNKNTTQLVLIPLERGVQTGYEVISPTLRKRIIQLLGSYNAFEAKAQTNTANLLPDHKFPEISWDDATKKENLEDLTDDAIKEKFQLLDNQRNLQKREVCRQVFQTKKRGTVYGIKYYYSGTEDWPNGVPLVGKEAEKGWYGSPWYDIEAWRKALNNDLDRLRKMDIEGRYIPRD